MGTEPVSPTDIPETPAITPSVLAALPSVPEAFATDEVPVIPSPTMFEPDNDFIVLAWDRLEVAVWTTDVSPDVGVTIGCELPVALTLVPELGSPAEVEWREGTSEAEDREG
jgi:hypothetical protein